MADDVRITVKGTEQITKILDSLGERAIQALEQSLHEVGEELMTRSKMLVPVDTSALRASGVAQPVERQGDVLVETLSYGGTAGATVAGKYVGYAIYVHENMQAHHVNGQAKFLEQPVMEAVNDLPELLAEGLRARLKELG